METNPNQKWVECSGSVSTALSDDESAPSYLLIPALTKSIHVSFFNGDMDLICNWMGLKDMVDTMDWNGAKGFKVITIFF